MRRLTLSVLLAIMALPATAQAGFFPAEVIDGPNSDLMGVSSFDLARDGQGGVLYMRRDGGVPHVFFSRFVDGAFQGPSRVDVGLSAAATDADVGPRTTTASRPRGSPTARSSRRSRGRTQRDSALPRRSPRAG